MTPGISNVNTSYFIENGGCAVKITGEWEADHNSAYAICGCYIAGANYLCFEWGNRFNANAGESGTFELYGMDALNYVSGYDFYYAPGENVDISLLADPFDPFISPPVGRQQAMVWETCQQKCTPGTRICDGNFVYECNSNGTAYDVLVEYCIYGCEDGVCLEKPEECTPGTKVCRGNDIYACNIYGTAYNDYITTCVGETYCTDGVCVGDADETLEMLMYTAVGIVGVATAIIIGKELI